MTSPQQSLSLGAVRPRIAIALLAAVLAGCGDDPPPASAPRPAVEQPKVGFAPRRKVEEKPKGIDLTGVDPDAIFEEAETPLPNFVAVGPAPPKPEEQFMAEVSLPGRDSSNFVATLPNGSAASSSTPDTTVAFQMPPGFAAVESAPLLNGLPTEIRCLTDGSQMVLVSAGEGVIGSDSGPQHWGPRVRLPLDAFYVAVREVTVGQYMLCRQKAGVVGKKMEVPLNVDGPSDHPAVGITWGEARMYAQWIGGDLPTEAQWEKAARGPLGFRAPWGNSRPLWRVPRSLDQIDSAGSHPDDRSTYGALDMAGNAREWTADFFREDSLQSLSELEFERRRNWTGPRNSPDASRVVKGNGADWTVWNRDGIRMNERVDRVGFRCVLNLPGTAAPK